MYGRAIERVEKRSSHNCIVVLIEGILVLLWTRRRLLDKERVDIRDQCMVKTEILTVRNLILLLMIYNYVFIYSYGDFPLSYYF